ncbi:cupin domain-containing protein [Marinobacteraceae bacterium S3BR75-40.1]
MNALPPEPVTADDWIQQLQLEPHPEGGHYRRLFTAPETVITPRGERPTMTAIHYLLRDGEHSAFHRLHSHELWHWHTGTALHIHCLEPDGSYRCRRLGPGGDMTLAIPPRHWFAAELAGVGDYALVTCTVTPGFDFADFEWGHREPLAQDYPGHRDLIHRLGQ